MLLMQIILVPVNWCWKLLSSLVWCPGERLFRQKQCGSLVMGTD